MPPSLRSKKQATVLDDSSSPSPPVDHPSTVTMIPDPNLNPSTTDTSLAITSDRFEILLRSIKANQVNIDHNQAAIQALVSKLDITSSALETTSKHLITLSDQVEMMTFTISKTIPQELQSSVETVKSDLRVDFSTAITDLSTKVYQDLNAHHSESLQCFKSHASSIAHLATDVSALSRTLSTIQDTTLSKLDVERLVVAKWQDELDPHIQSHYDLKKEIDHKFSTLDSTIKTTIEAHLDTHSPLTTSTTGTVFRPRSALPSTGFHQADSRDFCVSKLQKEIKDIKLFGDKLKELELFWDAILCAFTNLCHLQIYPYYRDLKSDFDFYQHLIGDENNTSLSSTEYHQATRNYRTFGDALRIFLHAETTISETTSPTTYLRLISLCDKRDGFIILRDLIFSLSPQLSGDYYDFRQDIMQLSIHPGEHLSKF